MSTGTVKIWRTIIAKAVPEKVSATFTGTLKDDTGVAIPGANLFSLTLWLYDQVSKAIINSRSAQNILGINGGAVDALGKFTLQLGPSDHVLQSQDLGEETHIALLEFTWSAGAKTGRHEIWYPVTNLEKIT